MGLRFSRGSSTADREQPEPGEPTVVTVPMSRGREPSSTALVITEPSMCAHCFDSIVAQFNGSATSTTRPSFANSSQCVDRIMPDADNQLGAVLTSLCELVAKARYCLWKYALPAHYSSQSRCRTTAASSSSAAAWAVSRRWPFTRGCGITPELGAICIAHIAQRQYACSLLTAGCVCGRCNQLL